MTARLSDYLKLTALLALAAVLGGCAMGRTYSYSNTPVALQGVSSGGAVALGVQDQRPYVVSGGKSDRFVGLMRGGFGNPFDVNTQSGGPLALEMRDALAKALKDKGISVSPVTIGHSESAANAKRALQATRARRQLLVTLNEWKSDTMMNTTVHYDVTLVVMNDAGATLATNKIKGADNIGSLGLSPGAGISATFAKKIGSLFDDDKVAAAIK